MMKKFELIRYKQVDHIYNEMIILASAKHPFIVKLEGYMQDSIYFSLIEEFIIGGDLFTYLNKKEKLDIYSTQ